MAKTETATPEPAVEFAAGPSRLDRPGLQRMTWHHTIKAGRDWHDCLNPQYWWIVADRLGPGHRIEIATSDHRIMFEAIVIYANPHGGDHPQVDLYFRPIMPMDLALPTTPAIAEARWVAEQLSINGNWQVRDVTTGEVVQSDLYKHGAQILVGHLARLEAEREKVA
jgi:hypothetical protein